MAINQKSGLSLEFLLYSKVFIFSLLLFGINFGYLSWLKTPNGVNKSFADTAMIVMGLSMILSSLAYFTNFFKPLLLYRKYLGLVGFAYLLAHIALSFGALQSLFTSETWTKGTMWPVLTGLVSTLIFGGMAAISNQFSSQLLGGTRWRFLLRTGYIALLLGAVHAVLLKSGRWMTWYNDGMTSLPSLSLLVTVGVGVVLLMRAILWLALKAKNRKL